MAASQAQIRIIPRETLDAVAFPWLSQDSLSLDFSTRHIMAGTMKEDDLPGSYRVEMSNIGKETVDIYRLQTSCSCVSVSAGQKVLRPGDSTSLIVRYDPKGHLGQFEHKVFIYTRPGNSPAAVLRLSVRVEASDDISRLYKVGMGKIALRSRTVNFRKGQKGIEVLKYINLSGKPLKLECEETFLPKCITFETKPQMLEDGKEGEMIITYDPSQGDARGHIPLILQNLGVSPSGSTIDITIE